MASKKGGGSTKNGRDSNPQYRGVKKFGGQCVIPGNIIVRQVGNTFHAGSGVGCGRDYTLFAINEGSVYFSVGRHGRKFVSIV